MMYFKFLLSAFLFTQIVLLAAAARALSFKTTIKNHRFQPAIIHVPAEKEFELEVYNDDRTTEEFESQDLNKEKFVGPKKTVKMTIRPLKPGEYGFYGEFNESTAQGKIIAE